MNAFFMAKGPSISKCKRPGAVNAVDLYNLFCLILDIECGQNDGSKNPNIWNKLLRTSSRNCKGMLMYIITWAFLYDFT